MTMIVDGWEARVAQADALRGEAWLAVAQNMRLGRDMRSADPFVGAVVARCSGCKHWVSFQSEEQMTRFIVSSGWVHDGSLVLTCQVCVKAKLLKAA